MHIALLVIVMLLNCGRIASFRSFLGYKTAPTNRATRAFSVGVIEYQVHFNHEFKRYLDYFPNITNLQRSQLCQLYISMRTWNEKVNLVSRKDVDNLVSHHIVPSMCVSLVRPFQRGDKVIDVGTGGGLPGIPLAILCPNASFTLLDSSIKKMAVVADMVKVLGLKNVNVVTSRAEKYRDEQFNVVLGRAVASIPDFLSYSAHFLADSGTSRSNRYAPPGPEEPDTDGVYYIKGGDFRNELVEAKINKFELHSVDELVDELEVDKFILHIPPVEVENYRRNQIQMYKERKASSKPKAIGDRKIK